MPHQLLDDVMRGVGEEAASKHVEFVGADPVLPLPLRVGEISAAAIGATAVQAARLWQMRTGRMQTVRIDVDAAAVALMSQRFIRPEAVSGVLEPPFMRRRQEARVGMGSRIVSARDGRWIFLHREFEHHRQRMEALLQSGNDEQSITAAVAKWDAFQLEDAIFAAGACAGVIRDYSEWDEHPQAITVDAQPLVEVVKIGESAPEPLTAVERPLSGTRVLDLTRVIAGPTCARTLAEHGADVLRIANGTLDDNEVQRMDTGHGKRSTVLDITSAEGASTLRHLAQGADVFSQSYRPGALAKRGFAPEDLAALRPGIIYVSISAWSHEGAWSERRGFESVVQAVSGVCDDFRLGGQPRLMPANAIDYGTGFLAAFGAMVALGRRAREGGSYLVRVSLAKTGRWITRHQHVSPEERASVPSELPRERLEELMISSETPFGRIRHLGPVAQMSETPARWQRPTVPPNHDRPEWLV
ncbi:MAG TPA: CoA transferase [Dehalococcoidia bacterium]|nr:CoA transferase [Dehalococcoidia bacterium]